MDIELNFSDIPDLTEDFGSTPSIEEDFGIGVEASGVISVNGKTGRVVLEASDLNAQEKLVSGKNIKTINGNSLLGSGNIEISGGVEQVYRGATQPTDNNILIWIDTGIPGNQLFTSDGKEFITSDNKIFITA